MRSLMLKDASRASGVRSVVNSTMVRDSPSTPTWKVEWSAAYQVYCSWNWKPGCPDLNCVHRKTVRTKGTRLAPKAVQRMAFRLSVGRHNTTTAARTGKNRMRVKR